ncbi:MAG: shikimate dehydrogenase, partial [Spirochaetia bacterium]|nr:shikimate dehydrogenase [Spirochaetia bacterium]
MSAAPHPIDAHTECYGVLGFPVRHSRSPAIFNAAFQNRGRNAVYLAFEQEDTARAIEAMRCLGIRGMSVTIPHKENAMKCVDETDESARRVGCLNTIINNNGRLIGYNFDGEGAVTPLDSFFPDWKEKKIVFIGAGGSARGIALAMASVYGAKKIAFLARSPDKAAPLVRELEALGVASGASTLNEKSVDADLLINTTPIGMHPNTEATPFPASFF